MYLLAIVKGMIITIKHLFTRKVTIQYLNRSVNEVHRGQHQLKRDKEENCTACALSCPAEAITMTAAEAQADEKHLYREEKCFDRNKYVALYFFAVYVKMHVQRRYLLTTSKHL
jgi:NADH-quinone oxidoreductase subunit I